jgi:hypothetical protein
MTEPTADPVAPLPASRFGWLKLFVIVVAATCVATLISVWAVSTYLFPTQFKPVTLNAKEEKVLEQKINRLDAVQYKAGRNGSARNIKPERYSEEEASREIVLAEKELNALLARNPDLASHFAIDLSDEMASAKLLVPLDDDFPLLGGKTVKVSAGLELSYRDGKPVLAIAGVSLWGVPIPNAWLGNLKNVDLVKEYGGQKGFWSAFAAGVDEIKITDGQLLIRLKK